MVFSCPEISVPKVFLLSLRSLERLESSGRLVGLISTYPDTFPTFWFRIMTPKALYRIYQNETNSFSQIFLTYTEENVPPLGFLVITRNPERFQVPGWVEMNPTSLPELFKPLKYQKNSRKTPKIGIKIFKNFENVPLLISYFSFLGGELFFSVYRIADGRWLHFCS